MKSSKILLFFFVSFLLSAFGYAHAKQSIEAVSDLKHGNPQVGEYRALIIGINDYQDQSIPDLNTAAKDAQQMAQTLESNYGFQVQLLIDEQATKKNIYQALRALVGTVEPEDSVLLYYAGHGDIDHTFNDGWWIPFDADGGDPITYLDNVQVHKAIKNMQARHVLLISDSCYAGALFGRFRNMPKIIDDKYYLSLYNEKSRWGMTSGNKTPVGDDGTDGHSFFAYQLLKQLKENKKPYISTQEIFAQISPIVSNNSEQTPMYRPMRNSGDQGGEFIFIASSGAVIDTSLKIPTKSTLSVTANVPFAEVYLNGDLIGKTNISNAQFAPGKYKIKVQLSGYNQYERYITLSAGHHKELHAFLDKESPAKSSLYINTDPENAQIQILNAPIDFYQGVELYPGQYHIKVSAQGYAPSSTWITLASAEDKTLDVSLNAQDEASNNLINTGETGNISDNSSTQTTFSATPPSTDPDMTVSNSSTLNSNDENIVTNSIGMNFIYVKAGEFNMGSPEKEKGRSIDEDQHKVTLTNGFHLGQHEVTVGQWRIFVKDTGYQTAAEIQLAEESDSKERKRDYTYKSSDYTYVPSKSKEEEEPEPEESETPAINYWDSPGFSQTDNHPVTCITVEDAEAFIEWLSKLEGKTYRLPTEAEWEFACRAGTQSSRYWGYSALNACRFANIADQALKKQTSAGSIHQCDDGFVYTAPAGSFGSNNYGFYDMMGNVSEWCQDKYGKYESTRKMGYMGITESHVLDAVDPTGLQWGLYQVIRGGNWQSDPADSRSAARSHQRPAHGNNQLGFRLAADF